MLVSTEWLGVRVWGSYEKDCCNPMITVSTQNRKVLISPEKGRNNVSWKTLNCSIHLCLTEESKHTDSSVVQTSCHGETESHLVSHISCVHATVWSTTREEKTFQGRDYSCKIWGCSFCRTCNTWKSCYFLFKTLNTYMDFYRYLALILVETLGVQRAIFPNLLSSYNHPKAIQKLSLHQGNENSWVSRGVLYLPGFVLRCTWRAGRSRAKMWHLASLESWVESAFMKIWHFVTTTAWVGTPGHCILMRILVLLWIICVQKSSVVLRQSSCNILSSNYVVLT